MESVLLNLELKDLPDNVTHPPAVFELLLGQLVPLLHCKWFTRTWTIQEAGLKDGPMVYWGEHQFELDKICLVCMLVAKCFKESAEYVGILRNIELISNLFKTYLPTPGPKRLLYILDEARLHDATDPRVKVYAFMLHPAAFEDASEYSSIRRPSRKEEDISDSLACVRNLAFSLLPGLASENADIWVARLLLKPPSGPMRAPSPDRMWPPRGHLDTKSAKLHGLRGYHWSFVRPIYSDSLVTIYQDLAIKVIQKFNSLEILSFVQHNASFPPTGPPSWVPRWDISHDVSILGKVTCDHSAAANCNPVFSMTSNSRGLMVRALFFDRVGIRSIPLTRRDFLDPTITSPVFSLAKLCRVDKHPVPPYPRIPTPISGGCDRLRAYQKTWTAGYSSTRYGDDPDFLAYQEEFILRRAREGTSSDYDLKILASISDRKEEGVASKFAHVAADACYGRKFFLTKSGFFGIGPGIMENEDTVAVVLGHDVPMILRERSKLRPGIDGYLVVGEYYVDGIMCDETIRAWGGPDGGLRDIELC